MDLAFLNQCIFVDNSSIARLTTVESVTLQAGPTQSGSQVPDSLLSCETYVISTPASSWEDRKLAQGGA